MGAKVFRWGVLLGLTVAAVLTGATAAVAAAPGTIDGGSVAKTGWWWSANATTPADGAVAAPRPPAPGVPKDAMAVAAVKGDADKISAIEFTLDAAPGSTLETFSLSFAESAEPGSQVNSEAAAILACPVTDAFWAGEQSANWDTKPAYDCSEANALGKRSEKGVWSFDLSALAATWTAADFTGSRSVVLVPHVEAPASFQTVLAPESAKGIGLKITAQPPPKSGAGDPSPSPTAPDSTPPSTSGAPTVPTTDSGGAAPPAPPVEPPPLAEVPAAPTGEVPAAAPAPAAPVAGAVPVAASGQRPWWSGLPWLTVLALPLGLGLAYVAMVALGPDSQPMVATTGRVTSALARLRQAGSTPIAAMKGLATVKGARR